MKKVRFYHISFFRSFVAIIYALLLWKIIKLSREVKMTDAIANELKSVEFEIDLCYPLNLPNETYEIEKDDKIISITKVDFDENCKFEHPLAHYTKDFKKKKAGEIISKFKKCKIENLIPINKDVNAKNSSEVIYTLYFGKICLRHKFEFIQNYTKKLVDFSIQPKNYVQKLDIYASITTNQENETYRSVKKHLVKRNCWLEKETQRKCLETDKSLTLSLNYFLIRNLKPPFDTNCEDRENGLNQNDCYEKCIRKQKNHYLLSYDLNDTVELDYSDFKTMESLSKKCSLECDKPDCKITAFYIHSIDSNKNDDNSKMAINIDLGDLESNSTESSIKEDDKIDNKHNSIIIKGHHESFRIEALPVFKKSKVVWMILISISVFFGLDIYGFFVKTTEIYQHAVARHRKDKRITIKKQIFSIGIFMVCLTFAICCEKWIFNFGLEEEDLINKTYYSEIESTKERNVSFSICYDLCEILKTPNNEKLTKDNCNKESLIDLTIGQLNSITWNVNDFKKRISLRNTIRIVPIRHLEFELPVFFRNFKKCFLIYYKTLDVFPHLPMMRKSQIYFKFEPYEDRSDGDKIYKYDYFFIEDGDEFNFPKLNSLSAKKSVLHAVETIYKVNNCTTNAYKNNSHRDELIQKCLIEKYLENSKGIPIFVNLKLDKTNNKTEEYLDKKFLNEDELNEVILDECEKKYPNTECITSITYPTTEEIYGGEIGDLTVNLSPFLFEIRLYTERENVIIVIQRIFSFITLFTCFSVCQLLRNFVGTYLYSLASIYNFQFIKKLSYFIGFILFLIHFGVVLYAITHSITKTYNRELMKTIVLPRFRVCYEHYYDNVKTFSELREENIFNESILYKDLVPYTWNYTHLISKILVHQEDNRIEEIGEKQIKELQILYIDNLKCFNFEIEKEYDIVNPNVPKLETLIEFHLDLSREYQREKKVYLFTGSKGTFNLDNNKPFKIGVTKVDYLTREYLFEDGYWIFKNLFRYIKHILTIERIENLPADYLTRLSLAFANEQYATTTSIFLFDTATRSDIRFNLPIQNRIFNSFIHFRSIDGNKNDYFFSDNGFIKAYSPAVYEEGKKLDGDNIAKIHLRSNLIKIVTRFKNTYHYMELFLHFLILMKLYFKFNILFIPELLRSSFPAIQFIVYLILYFLVVSILTAFEMWLKFVKFLDIRD